MNDGSTASVESCLHIVNMALSLNQWHSVLANKTLWTINTRQLHKDQQCLDTHIYHTTYIDRKEWDAGRCWFWPIDCVFASGWCVLQYWSLKAERMIWSECGQRC